MGNDLQPKPLSLAYWLYLPIPAGHEVCWVKENGDTAESSNPEEFLYNKMERYIIIMQYWVKCQNMQTC